MTRARKIRPSRNANHLRSLLLTFHAVRILNYIAAGPLGVAEITAHLCRNGHLSDPSAVNRLLAHMARAGWITPKRLPSNPSRSPSWATTPAGRATLAQARHCLKHLAQLEKGLLKEGRERRRS